MLLRRSYPWGTVSSALTSKQSTVKHKTPLLSLFSSLSFRNALDGFPYLNMACLLVVRNIKYTDSIYWQAQSVDKLLPVDHYCQSILCQCPVLSCSSEALTLGGVILLFRRSYTSKHTNMSGNIWTVWLLL